jgi:iron complex outermembrane receptor protein
VTANINDRLRLVGGIRYTDDSKTFRSVGISGTVVCNARVNNVPSCPNVPLMPLVDFPNQLPFPFPPQGVPALPIGTTGAIIARSDTLFNSALADDRITWRAAVEYDVAPRSLLYASIETGYRSGGFAAAVGRETYNPEYITAYTLGMKNRLLGNRLQLDIEAFYWDYTDQQVNRVGLDATGRTSNFTSNVGKAEIYGVEVNARALVTRTTMLSADIAYVHTRNEDYVFSVGAQTPPLTGCPFTLSGNQYLIDCSGFPANNAPEWTINLAAQQTIPLGEYQFVLGADTQYKSGRYINFYYVTAGGGYVDHSWVSNAQIAFGPVDERWSLALYVRNIEDNRIPAFFSPAPITNLAVVGTSPPRTYGIRGSIRF